MIIGGITDINILIFKIPERSKTRNFIYSYSLLNDSVGLAKEALRD